MDKILGKKDLPRWLRKLASTDVYAPRLKDDVWTYALVDDPEAVSLDYPQTAVPAKALIFPSREFLLEFRESEGAGYDLTEIRPEGRPLVVFGVRPCEGKALTLMDKVFGGEFVDPYYAARRQAATLVGLACNVPPSPNCFCVSVNGLPHSQEGLDVLLTDLGDRYYVKVLTPKGKALVAAAGPILKDAKPEDKIASEKSHAASEKKLPRTLRQIKDIHLKLKAKYGAPFWEEESLGCIRCGICTYLCPTCHCFDINDEIESPAPLVGKRVRTWDTCQFPDFTMHSSGHNPRPDKASRLRQRINHKFQYFVEAWHEYQCVGCGRCISLCPVGIDIIQVVEKARDYVG
jgi:sulfhydrogenase subunit beta (sulfur reductase)